MIRICLIVMLMLLSAPAYADEEAHRQAAQELVEVSGVESAARRSMGIILDQIGDSMSTAMPGQMQCFDDAFMERWKTAIANYMDFSSFTKFATNMYMEEFTEDELKQIIAFNRSPVGQKAMSRLPTINKKSMEFAESLFKNNEKDIQQSIATLVAEQLKQCKAKQDNQ